MTALALLLLSVTVAPPLTTGASHFVTAASPLVTARSHFVDVALIPTTPLDAGIVVLDARDKALFDKWHIPGAQPIDWTDYREGLVIGGRLPDDHAELTTKLARLGVDDARPVLVCGGAGAAWGEEGRIAWMLRTLGHKDTAILDGGCDAWLRAKRPFVQTTTTPVEGTFTPRYTAQWRIEKNDVGSAIANGKAVLIDARTKAEYDGAQKYLEPRGGHIPGAVHLEWNALLSKEGLILDEKSVRAHLQSAGIDATKPLIVYCTGGVRSAFVVEVLRARGIDARNYDGSFWEWSWDPRLDVSTTSTPTTTTEPASLNAPSEKKR